MNKKQPFFVTKSVIKVKTDLSDLINLNNKMYLTYNKHRGG